MGMSRSRLNLSTTRPVLADEFSTASHMRVSTGPGATSVVRIGEPLSSMRREATKLLMPALVAQ